MKTATYFLATCLVLAQCTWGQESNKQETENNAAQMQDMMKRMQQFTQPGEQHKLLEKFLGNWTVETRFVMEDRKSDPEQGTCEYGWQIDGRWLKSEIKGTMMGRPIEGFTLMGYDNFKQSFVATSVQSLDTAMLRFEGDLSRDGKSLVMYGKMDEYLTGEHDKMVKYAFRFVDDDTIVLEVHDLHIGETGSMVVEQTLKRVKN